MTDIILVISFCKIIVFVNIGKIHNHLVDPQKCLYPAHLRWGEGADTGAERSRIDGGKRNRAKIVFVSAVTTTH